MKKENCPFCAHRWIRKSSQSLITCPNCKTEYYVMSKQEELYEEEEFEEEILSDDF